MTDQPSDERIPVMRIPMSLPCQVPVFPGTPSIDEPIEERTERCAVDAWWIIGRGVICNLHLHEALPAQHARLVDELAVTINEMELRPWAQMHRYDQAAAIPEWETTAR